MLPSISLHFFVGKKGSDPLQEMGFDWLNGMNSCKFESLHFNFLL